MGRHYGIRNNTQHMLVSEGNRCWTNNDFCDCHEVMHRYGWKITDDIYSACYCSRYNFQYDESTGSMDPVADTCDDGSYDINENLDDDENIYEEINNTTVKETVYAGFNATFDPKVANHAPIWKDNKCCICGYIFDPKCIEDDKKMFGSAFCMC